MPLRSNLVWCFIFLNTEVFMTDQYRSDQLWTESLLLRQWSMIRVARDCFWTIVQSIFWFRFSGSRQDGNAYWFLHHEALQVHSTRNHRLDSDMSARIRHRPSAKLLRRVSLSTFHKTVLFQNKQFHCFKSCYSHIMILFLQLPQLWLCQLSQFPYLHS